MQLYIDTVTATGQWLWALGDLDPGQPQMIRAAAILADGPRVIDRMCRLVSPLPGRPYMTPQGVLLTGIGHDDLTDQGVVLGAVLARLTMFINRAHLIVGHNIDFHTRVMRHAFADGALPMPELPAQFCTMRKSMRIVGAKNELGRIKFPRLAEAYSFFAGHALELPAAAIGRGDAMVDAVHMIHAGLLERQAEAAPSQTSLFDPPSLPPAA
jgi:DNA polymerase III epsilon subunit-like protein